MSTTGEPEGATAKGDKEDTPERIFTNPEEEVAFWKTLATNYKQKTRRLSAEAQSGKEATTRMQEELEQVRKRLDSLTATGTEEAEPSRRSGAEVVTSSNLVSLDTVPKLTLFNGKDGPNDYPYTSWRFDIHQLICSGFPSRAIRMAIVRSCRGTPATVLQSLGHDFQPQTVISAFDKRFASVATSESILGQFYTATQKELELVNDWGCRLESLLTKPQMSYLSVQQKGEMLRERFWRGLRTETAKNALRHRVDSGATYEQLLVCAREVESEMGEPSSSKSSKSSTQPSKKATAASAQATEPSLASQLEDIKARLIALEKRLPPNSKSQSKKPTGRGNGDRGQQQSQAKSGKKPTCYECGVEGHYRNKCPKLSGNKQVKGE